MRTPMPRPLLLAFSLIATLSLPHALPALDFLPYVGGGLRLGYVVDEGLSLGAEVTLGVLLELENPPSVVGLTSIALGIQTMPTEPRRLTYVSWAAAAFVAELTVAGAAVGKTHYSIDGKNHWGTRRILWGGAADYPFFL